MSLGERMRRLVCPRCTEKLTSNEGRRDRTVSILEWSVTSLDLLAARMADDRNLGDNDIVNELGPIRSMESPQ